MGKAIPVGLAAEIAHGLFPGLTIEKVFGDGDGDLDAGAVASSLDEVFDFFAEFDVADEIFAIKDGLDDPEGKGAEGADFEAGGEFAGAFGVASGEAVDDIAVSVGRMNAEDAGAFVIEEV